MKIHNKFHWSYLFQGLFVPLAFEHHKDSKNFFVTVQSSVSAYTKGYRYLLGKTMNGLKMYMGISDPLSPEWSQGVCVNQGVSVNDLKQDMRISEWVSVLRFFWILYTTSGTFIKIHKIHLSPD